MVSSCCVRGCTEKFVKGGGISYFRISSKPELQRNAWIDALQRTGWTPKPHHRICSRHFVTGTWNADPTHVDYVPTINMCSTGCDTMDTWNASLSANDVSDLGGSYTLTNGAISKETGGGGRSTDHTIHHPPSQFPASCSALSSALSGSLGSSNYSSQTHISSRKASSVNSTATAAFKRRRHINTVPKLRSSHFCEHKDIHRNCCRVIRELAEENQILKAQVDFLLLEVQKLQAEALANHVAQNNLNMGLPTLTSNDIEIVSNSGESQDGGENGDFMRDNVPEIEAEPVKTKTVDEPVND